MGNLTEISIGTRKFFIWMVIVFIAYLILKTFIGIGINYWKTTHPPPIPPPLMQFGKLPPPKLASKTSTSGLKFNLENIEGQPALDKPQEATYAGKVYQMPKKLPTYLSDERAKKFAFKLGFTKEPKITDSTQYYFVDPEDPLRTLTIDIINMNFRLSYDWTKNTEVLTQKQFVSKEQAVNEVKTYLQVNSLFDNSILQSKTTTTDFLIVDSDKKNFTTTTSLSKANAIRINFFRGEIDKMKLFPPLFNQSYIYVIYTPALKTNQQMLDISWSFWPIAYDSFGTYPIKSVSNAWQDLVDGYASVINMGNNSPENIVIRHISLAYYDSEESQQYLQPIYVFEGDNNFVAYLPAITSDWLKEEL